LVIDRSPLVDQLDPLLENPTVNVLSAWTE
jgi:hypothetical protein